MSYLLQRKYIDLIRRVSSKWVNWNPPIQIRVGSFGKIDKETGDLIVEGNIYDPEFQEDLDKHDVKISMANFPPQEGPVEDDFVIASRGAKRQDIDSDSESKLAGITNASFKGQWSFERDKRDAVLIMHNPRQIFLPPNVVLEQLYKVDRMVNKHLVTNIHVCPAYSMYLSDKSGDKATLALVAKVPADGVVDATADASGGFTWLVNTQDGLFREGSDKAGDYNFTPLYSLRRPIKRYRRFFRDAIRPEPAGDGLWYNDSPPWDPLDEDGVEDPFTAEVTAVDPFAHVTPPGVLS